MSSGHYVQDCQCLAPGTMYCMLTGMPHDVCADCHRVTTGVHSTWYPFCPSTGRAHPWFRPDVGVCRACGMRFNIAAHCTVTGRAHIDANTGSGTSPSPVQAPNVVSQSSDGWQAEIIANYQEALDRKRTRYSSPAPTDYVFEDEYVLGEVPENH